VAVEWLYQITESNYDDVHVNDGNSETRETYYYDAVDANGDRHLFCI